MRYALPILILCLACAQADSLLPGMVQPAYRDWAMRPGAMYGFWLCTGARSIADQMDRTGANATSVHMMMGVEQDGAEVRMRAPSPPLEMPVSAGVGVGEHNNPFFVRYPEWFWGLHQEARMKDRDGRTILAGDNRVPAMDDPLLTRLAKDQMTEMVRLLGDRDWVRYWVIGGEESWPDYFGLPEGDYRPAARRHFAAWKAFHTRQNEVLDASVAKQSGAAEASRTSWREFRDPVVIDRYAGYTAHLHALDPTRSAMIPTHGNPFTFDFRSKLGYPIADLVGVADGFEAGPISIDDDCERLIRMTLDQQTSFGLPVAAPRLGNKQLDPSARGGGRTFTPASLRRTVYEALGLGVGHIGLVQWAGDLPDGEWGIAGRPAEVEAKRVFEELRLAGPYLDGCSRLQPRVGVFISDATWSRWWQDRWTLLYDEAIRRGWSVVLLTDPQIDAGLASRTPVLISVDNRDIAPTTQVRLSEYTRAGGRIIIPEDVDGPTVRVIHQTQTTEGANTWPVEVKPLPMDAIEAAIVPADLRPVIVLENGKHAEGIEPLLLTDGTNMQVVLVNRTKERRNVRLSSDNVGPVGPVGQVRDLLTGELVPGDITIEPLGTALVSLETPISAEMAKSEVEKAEAAAARWTKLGAEGHFASLLTRAQDHLKAERPSKAYALARSITHSLALRNSVDGLRVEALAWDADGRPAKNARVRMRLVPGKFEWSALHETSPGVYRIDLRREDLPLFYNPSTEKYELADGATEIIVDASVGDLRGGMRASISLNGR